MINLAWPNIAHPTHDPDRDLSHLTGKLELGYNDTLLLMKLSRREGSDYEDTTSEQNVKNEIGPISNYVDRVKSEEMLMMNEVDDNEN